MIELDRTIVWEPPRRRLPTRPVAVVAVLVAVLALVAGAGATVRLAPAVVLQGDGVGTIRVEGDALFLIRRSDPAHALVESYRVADGGRRWSRQVATSTEFVDVAHGRVVLTVLSPGQDHTHTLVALDATSGEQVWSRADYTPSLYGSAGGTGVVLAEPYNGGAAPERSSGPMAGIDTVTGEVRWSLVTPVDVLRSFVSVDGDATHGRVEIAEFDRAGVLRLRSAESGAVVRTVTLDRPGRVDSFDVAGDRLLAHRFGERTTGQRGMQGTAVFDLGTGARLWERTVEPGSGPFWYWWCGPTVCEGTETATAVLEPDTGRRMWRLDGWTNLDPLGDDRMLATRSTPTGEPQPGAFVIDATDGRIIRQIDDWDLVSRPALPTVLLAGRAPAGAVRIARFDVDSGRMTVLGRAERWTVQPECVATTEILACRHGPISIWRIPSS